MLATPACAPLRRRTLAMSCAAFAALAGLAACSGSPDATTPLPLTIAATDASGTFTRGQTATFTVTVTNPSPDDLAMSELSTTNSTPSDADVQPLQIQGVTCAAQHATCPAVSGAGGTGPFTLPAGSVLTFTVTTLVGLDYAGPVDLRFQVFSLHRQGVASATAHATLADARDGYYELFATSGARDNVVVAFKAGATKFATAPYPTENTFVRHLSGYVFPSGLVFDTAPDLLVGQADFGSGPETFVGVRELVYATADLDGLTFTALGVSSAGGAAAASTLRTMAISGSSMDVCADAAAHTIATCPGGSLRRYALTLPPSGGPIFTATDSADGDTFDFQVARSGDALILLQADRLAGGGVFAVGFANAAVPANSLWAYGNFGGSHDAVSLAPGSFSVLPIDLEGNVLSEGPQAALAAAPGGPAALLAGTRPSDGAALLMQQQAGLVVVSGPAGELDLLIDATLTH